MPIPHGPKTQLRVSYERARRLDIQAQTSELVDHLEHPQIINGELIDAVAAVEAAGVPDDPAPCEQAMDPAADAELLLEHFYSRREITVRDDDPFVFNCVRGRFAPLAPMASTGIESPQDGHAIAAEAGEGVDYLGLIQDRERIGVLGVVQTEPEETAYQLLLRALCALTEVLPEEHSARLDERVFKGALGDQPILDLHIVIWNGATEDPTLSLLARDLADVVVTSLTGQTDFAAELGSICCLCMDPERFDGELRMLWRV